MTTARTSRPCVSVPTELLEAYRAARSTPAGASLPPLSTLLQQAIRDALYRVGVPAPEPPTPARTAAATAARWPAHAHEFGAIARRAASLGCRKVSSDLRALAPSSPADAASWLRAKLASAQDHTIPKMASVSERLYREAFTVVAPSKPPSTAVTASGPRGWRPGRGP